MSTPGSRRGSSRRWKRGRSGSIVLAAATVVSTSGYFASGAGTARADSTTDTLSPVTGAAGSIPNYFSVDAGAFANPPTEAQTSFVVDPLNHYLFESNTSTTSPWAGTPAFPAYTGTSSDPNWCADHPTEDTGSGTWFQLNPDNYGIVAVGCGGGGINNETANNNSRAPLAAVDSKDKVLFTADTTSAAARTQNDSIVASSESNKLAPLGIWPLPGTGVQNGSGSPGLQNGAGAAQAIFGMSWSPGNDQLLVMTQLSHTTTSGYASAPGDVTLLDYDIASLLATPLGQAPAPAWSYPLTYNCTQPMGEYSTFGTAAPYEGTDKAYIFAPCMNTVSGDQPATSVVNRLELSNGQPDGNNVSAEVPGTATDFYFDPSTDRGFMPTNTAAGASVMVYDGRQARFDGAVAASTAAAGSTNYDACSSFTIDSTTGRVYGSGPQQLVVADGRADPVQITGSFTQYAGPVFPGSTMVVIPPDTAFPSPRLIVSYLANPTPGCTSGALPSFPVFADSSGSAASAPPVESVDSNTHKGNIPAGAGVSSAFAGNAEAVGMRDVWTGSYGGLTNNVDTNPSPSGTGVDLDGTVLPFGGGVRDILQGWVEFAHLNNSSPAGQATALGDGTGTTTSSLRQCSDAQAVGACSGETNALTLVEECQNPTLSSSLLQSLGISCPTGAIPPGAVPDATPLLPNSTQPWPAGTAFCPDPKTGSNDVTSNGVTVTDSASTQPGPANVPAGNVASAEANCAPASGPAAVDVTAKLGASTVDVSGAPTVSVAQSTGEGSVIPAGAVGESVQATAAAVAKGIRISVPGAVLDIGEVLHTATASATGFAKGASGVDTVTVSDVSLTTSSGTTVFCQQTTVCTPQNLQQMITNVNKADPAYLEVSMPTPNMPFDTSLPTRDASGALHVSGSPGGYLGEIESSPSQQAYDHTFNDISSSDGETSLLPALRITLFGDTSPDGTAYGRDRQVVDLAAVEVDTENGINVTPPPGVVLPGENPPPCDATCIATGGTASQFIPGIAGQEVPGTSGQFLAGALTSGIQPADQGAGSPSGILGPFKQFFKRVLHGLEIILRSPAATLKFFGLLLLLALPVVVMLRRDQWLRGVFRAPA